jgi:hypothetical protein
MAANTKERSAEEIQEKYLDGLIEQMAEDVGHEFEFGDRLLRKIVSENRQPNFSESTFFKSKLGWDENRVHSQMRRMTNVVRLQAIAGRKADREALESEKETACEIAEKEVPKIDAQIEKLTRQKAQLEKAAANATRRCAEVCEAIEKLRSTELQRQDILENYNARKRHFGAGPQSRINELQIEIQHREVCLNKPKDLELSFWLDSIERLSPDSVGWVGEGSMKQRQLIEANWTSAQLKMLEEIQAMKNELDVLAKEKEEFEKSQKLVVEFYVEENK